MKVLLPPPTELHLPLAVFPVRNIVKVYDKGYFRATTTLPTQAEAEEFAKYTVSYINDNRALPPSDFGWRYEKSPTAYRGNAFIPVRSRDTVRVTKLKTEAYIREALHEGISTYEVIMRHHPNLVHLLPKPNPPLPEGYVKS